MFAECLHNVCGMFAGIFSGFYVTHTTAFRELFWLVKMNVCRFFPALVFLSRALKYYVWGKSPEKMGGISGKYGGNVREFLMLTFGNFSKNLERNRVFIQKRSEKGNISLIYGNFSIPEGIWHSFATFSEFFILRARLGHFDKITAASL